MEDRDFDVELLKRDARDRQMAMSDDNSAEIRTKLGSLRANGPVSVIILIVSLCSVGVAWAVRDHDVRSNDRSLATEKKIEAVASKIDEIVYVLTLDENQRKALRLDMPESMRSRTR